MLRSSEYCSCLPRQNRHKEARAETAEREDFLPFRDSRESVAEDVERIRSSPHLDPEIVVSGWMYDVDTGLLDRVV